MSAVNELLEVVLFAQRHTVGPNVAKAYRTLRETFAEMQNDRSPETTQQFQDALGRLRQLNSVTVPEHWSEGRTWIVNRLGFHDVVGQDIQYRLEGSLIAASGDTSAIDTELQAREQTASLFGEQVTRLAHLLVPLRENAGPVEHQTKHQIRVTFQGAASIRTLSELEAAAGRWNDFSSALARLAGKSPNDAVVTGVSKGSIIIDLLFDAELRQPAKDLLTSAAAIAESYVGFQKIRLDLKKLNMKEQAEEAADRGKEELHKDSANATEQLMKDHCPLKDEGDRNEVRNLVQVNLGRVAVFMSEKGRVDLLNPVSDADADSGTPTGRIDQELSATYLKLADKTLTEQEQRQLNQG